MALKPSLHGDTVLAVQHNLHLFGLDNWRWSVRHKDVGGVGTTCFWSPRQRAEIMKSLGLEILYWPRFFGPPE